MPPTLRARSESGPSAGVRTPFFLALVVDGALAGAIYALIALAFVVVYKASRMVNFALGEWMMLAASLVAAGANVFRLGLSAALVAACAGMVGLGFAFNHVVLRPLVGRPLISLIMVTLGLGAFLRGATAIALADVPRRIPVPMPNAPLSIHGLAIATDKLVAAAIAVIVIALLAWVFHATRAGVALRAIADDQQMAMAMGIDLDRYFSLTWAMVGIIAVIGGTLWTVVGSGGFGVVLLGLKVFPIVIIGGLDSIPGTIAGAVVVGVLESLAAGYVDPWLGGGFSDIAAYLVLIAVLFVRPFGLFGRTDVVRV
jgi:branched-chain amino acid transport system permease protein